MATRVPGGAPIVQLSTRRKPAWSGHASRDRAGGGSRPLAGRCEPSPGPEPVAGVYMQTVYEHATAAARCLPAPRWETRFGAQSAGRLWATAVNFRFFRAWPALCGTFPNAPAASRVSAREVAEYAGCRQGSVDSFTCNLALPTEGRERIVSKYTSSVQAMPFGSTYVCFSLSRTKL